MGLLPDFSNTALFPSFAELPVQDADDNRPVSVATKDDEEEEEEDWWLLAQVKHDMTITKPTLVLTDRSGAEFALVFDGYDRGGLDLAGRGLRGGATAAVRRARRTSPKPLEDGETVQADRKGFVRVGKGREGEVKVVPGRLERVMELGRKGGADGEENCATCGKGGELMKCLGCGRVRYCGKACQVRGWNEGGHKTDCKILKAMNQIWDH
ncbi:hypothetical protein NKR23_g855 [Pleurostoma richardsiae]|uniref:MYND-type domain-containing protein n=1 Tax=Pleurostoma richardsiae TaxID=41990 RepID=A0AA38VZS0_9PEZI|nr:hypothetical protein NKR23_g855 [Pleurostoma richardsiae]